jgi:hypothetical protein
MSFVVYYHFNNLYHSNDHDTHNGFITAGYINYKKMPSANIFGHITIIF